MIHMSFRGNDLAFQTDADGNPILLFIGKIAADGRIHGDRYSRVLKADRNGRVIKDHWDRKGRI